MNQGIKGKKVCFCDIVDRKNKSACREEVIFVDVNLILSSNKKVVDSLKPWYSDGP